MGLRERLGIGETTPADEPQKPAEPQQPEQKFTGLTGADIAAIIDAARRPSAEEEEERRAAKQRKDNSKRLLQEAIEEANRLKALSQEQCSHRKYDPVQQMDRGSAIQWMNLQDDPKAGRTGRAFGICQRCHKEFDGAARGDAGGVISGAQYQTAEPVAAE